MGPVCLPFEILQCTFEKSVLTATLFHAATRYWLAQRTCQLRGTRSHQYCCDCDRLAEFNSTLGTSLEPKSADLSVLVLQEVFLIDS